MDSPGVESFIEETRNLQLQKHKELADDIRDYLDKMQHINQYLDESLSEEERRSETVEQMKKYYHGKVVEHLERVQQVLQ